MHCDEAVLLEYLERTLDPVQLERLEAHLLSCEECWWRVRADRWGRDVVRAAREIAPAALSDRIALAMSLERGRPARPRRWRALAVAGALAVAATGAIWQTWSASPHRADPALVAAVVAVATSEDDLPDTLTVGADSVQLSRLDVGGAEVTIARSDEPFPMPAEADPVPGHPDAWAARRGSLSIVCVTRPSPLLVVGDADLELLVAAIS